MKPNRILQFVLLLKDCAFRGVVPMPWLAPLGTIILCLDAFYRGWPRGSFWMLLASFSSTGYTGSLVGILRNLGSCFWKNPVFGNGCLPVSKNYLSGRPPPPAGRHFIPILIVRVVQVAYFPVQVPGTQAELFVLVSHFTDPNEGSGSKVRLCSTGEVFVPSANSLILRQILLCSIR